jgi:hypothetical protein
MLGRACYPPPTRAASAARRSRRVPPFKGSRSSCRRTAQPGPPGSGVTSPAPGAASHPADMTSHDNAPRWVEAGLWVYGHRRIVKGRGATFRRMRMSRQPAKLKAAPISASAIVRTGRPSAGRLNQPISLCTRRSSYGPLQISINLQRRVI